MGIMLLVDSCSDLPLEYIEENRDVIDTIGMPINIEGIDCYDDFGKTMSHEEFYGYLRKEIMPTTSQINSHRFMEKFRENYEKKNTLIYLGFSSGLSGTFNSAVVAWNMFMEEHPDADITIIDTVSASVGEGLLVVHVVEMLRKGCSRDEIIKWVEDNKLNSNHWFAVDTLTFLKKGGRISAATAAFGTLLNVKPIITLDDEGKLKPYANVRGRKKSLSFLLDKAKEHIVNEEETIIIIGHGDCLNDAEELKSMVMSHFNVKKIIITQLGATIASHVGPGMISLAFMGERREVLKR